MWGDAWPEHVDLVLGGGGQDKGQAVISDDLFARADTIRALAADGVPMLLICGLYQLFGEYFETHEGERLPGINVLGVHTVGQDTRMIGNLVEQTEECGAIGAMRIIPDKQLCTMMERLRGVALKLKAREITVVI